MDNRGQMTPTEASRIITEAMGECWHEFDYTLVGPETALGILYRCKKCRTFMVENRPDYTTPDGFFKAWRWAQSKEWWSEFLRDWLSNDWSLDVYPQDHVEIVINYGYQLVNETTFAITLAEWLQKRGEK